MQVLIATNYLLPHVGGVEMAVDREVKTLIEKGHHVTIITSSPSTIYEADGLSESNPRIVHIPSWNGIERHTGIGWPVCSPSIIPALWRWVGWCDTVHVHGYL